MKKTRIFKFSALFSILLFSGTLHAQSNYCQQDRFSQTPLFDSADIVKDSNIVYAVSKDAFTAQMVTLKMDIYAPSATADTMSQRPFVLLIHGGAFLAGNKEDPGISYMCMEFARRGYVAASIDYRLGWNCAAQDLVAICFMCQGQPWDIKTATYVASQDARAALRYVHANAANWNIDPNWIFAGGESAGSITALHSTYWEQNEADAFCSWCQGQVGLLDTAGNNLPSNYVIRGVIDDCGAVSKDSVVMNNTNIPVVSFHDEFDCVVPNLYGQVISCLCQPFYYAAGSQAIYNKITAGGGCAEMNMIQGSLNHCSYPKNVLVNRASCFMKQVMCGGCTSGSIIGVNNSVNCDSLLLDVELLTAERNEINVQPNPSTGIFTVSFDDAPDAGELFVFNSTGQLVKKQAVSANENALQLDLRALPEGIYLLVCGQGRKMVVVGR